MERTRIARIELKKAIRPCVWANGSTQKDTYKNGLPEWCKNKGCDGIRTEGIMKECKRYLEAD